MCFSDSRCLECVHELQGSKLGQNFLSEQRSKSKKLDMLSYLITPVQRFALACSLASPSAFVSIPRYEMLLQAMTKSCNLSETALATKLNHASSKLHVIAQHVNEHKRNAGLFVVWVVVSIVVCRAHVAADGDQRPHSLARGQAGARRGAS